MYKIYYVKALDTRSSSCSATKKMTQIFKLPSNDSNPWLNSEMPGV